MSSGNSDSKAAKVNDLVKAGLDHFVQGDLDTALRLWLEAREEGGASPTLDAYLKHIQSLNPELYEDILQGSNGGRLRGGASSKDSGSWGPIPVPIPVATPSGNLQTPAVSLEPGRVGGTTLQPQTEPELPETFSPEIAKTSWEFGEDGTYSERPTEAEVFWNSTVDTRSAPQQVGPATSETPATDASTDPWDTDAKGEETAIEVQSKAPGLALVEVSPVGVSDRVSESELESLLAMLQKRYELDDFSGALGIAADILNVAPGHEGAKKVRADCREQLQKIYQSKIGDVRATPKLLMSPEELIWLDLDHRSGFVLAQVDGISSFEDIVEVTGMDRLESYRILAKLLRDGVVG